MDEDERQTVDALQRLVGRRVRASIRGPWIRLEAWEASPIVLKGVREVCGVLELEMEEARDVDEASGEPEPGGVADGDGLVGSFWVGCVGGRSRGLPAVYRVESIRDLAGVAWPVVFVERLDGDARSWPRGQVRRSAVVGVFGRGWRRVSEDEVRAVLESRGWSLEVSGAAG